MSSTNHDDDITKIDQAISTGLMSLYNKLFKDNTQKGRDYFCSALRTILFLQKRDFS